MRDFIIAANWKLNKNPDEAQSFCESLVSELKSMSSLKSQVVIFPPACNWEAVSSSLQKSSLFSSHLHWGPQNCYVENSGAFTGENSAAVAESLRARFTLVGHSERRQIFKESDDLLAQKVRAFQDLKLVPMLCVGETLEQRESGETTQVVQQQLKQGLAQADLQQPLTIAYEPVWAIGTGKVASVQQVEQVHAEIRQILCDLGDEEFSEKTPVLYGGSVKPHNAIDLAPLENVDGFLIGGASLQVESFLQIIQH